MVWKIVQAFSSLKMWVNHIWKCETHIGQKKKGESMNLVIFDIVFVTNLTHIVHFELKWTLKVLKCDYIVKKSSYIYRVVNFLPYFI